MKHRHDGEVDDRPLSATWARLALLAFGIASLAFLVVIDREEWFHIKPATGTAAAMSFAADRSGADGS